MYPSDFCLHKKQRGHCTVFAGKEITAAQHTEQGAVIILFQEQMPYTFYSIRLGGLL